MISIEEFENYLQRGEGLRTEFKEATKAFPQSAYETIVSFSNKEGGVIILGVDDDSNIKGVEVAFITKIKDDIIACCNNLNLIQPSVYPSVSEFKHQEKLLIIIKVPVSSQVHKLRGQVFDREGGVDMLISDQVRIEEIHFRKRQVFTENQIFPYLTIDDLDKNLFDKARRIIHGTKPFHPWLSIRDTELLRSASLLITDYKTGETGLTLAAALIFGKDTTIHSILPGYKVEAMVRIENKDRWDDRLTLRTNLIDTYLQLMDFIMKQKSLPGRFHLEGDQRIDLKNIIFREVIGNIIVHREYTNTLATELLVYSDKVTATNPNRANYRGPLDINTFTPYAKNPNIRKFFTTFGWTDEIGSGVRNVTKYLKFYVPGASPRFIEDDVFRTEIPLSVVTFYSISESLIKVLELNVEMREQVEEAFRILPVNEELHDAVTIKTVQNLVSVWHTNGQRMKQLGWPKLAFTKTAEEKDKSLHKKILQYIQILLFSFVAASMDRLMDLSGYESRTSFRNIYIKPLLEAGLLLRTIPDKPNSPHQQYVISKKGKNFLSGYAI